MIDSLLTEEIRAMVGRRTSYTAPEELGRAAIRYFALAVGDDNPLYTDEDFARAHGLRTIVAPPTLICETNQYTALPPDVDGFAGHSWHLDIPNTRLVRGGNSYVFHRYAHPDDVISATWEITDATERTTASGSRMLIITSTASYTGAGGDPIAENTETLIYVERTATRGDPA